MINNNLFVKKITTAVSASLLCAGLLISVSLKAQIDGYTVSGDIELEKISNLAQVTDANQSYSPDGQYLVYLNDQGQLFVEIQQDGSVVEIKSDGLDILAFDITADSSKVVYMDKSGAIYRIGIDGDEVTKEMLDGASLISSQLNTPISSRVKFKVQLTDNQQYLIANKPEFIEDRYDRFYLGGAVYVKSFETGLSQRVTPEIMEQPAINGGNHGAINFELLPSQEYVNLLYFVEALEGTFARPTEKLISLSVPQEEFERYDGLDYYSLDLPEYLSDGVNVLTKRYRDVRHDAGGQEGLCKPSYSHLSSTQSSQNVKKIGQPSPVNSDSDYFYVDYDDNLYYFDDEPYHLLAFYSFAADVNITPSGNFYTSAINYGAEAPDFIANDNVPQNDKYRHYSSYGSLDNSIEQRFLFPFEDAVFNCIPPETKTLPSLEPNPETGHLNVIEVTLVFQHQCESRFGEFALTQDESKLVFAAKPGGDNDTIRLYVSDFSPTQTGAPVEIAQINGNDLVDMELKIHNASGKIFYRSGSEVGYVSLDGSGHKIIGKAVILTERLVDEKNNIGCNLEKDTFVFSENNQYLIIQNSEKSVVVYDINSNSVKATINSEAELFADQVGVEFADIIIEGDEGLYRLNESESAQLPLASRQWNLVTVADANESGITLGQALMDSGVDIGGYGRNMFMYAINPDNAAYIGLGLDSMLMPGKGYWFIQWTGTSMNYALVGNGAKIESSYAGCSSSAGCYVLNVPSNGHLMQAIGNPLKQDVTWADVRVEVDGIICTPSQAHAEGYLADAFWHYNGSGYETYSTQLPPSGDAALAAYRGYWVQVFPSGLGKTINLLIPIGEVNEAQAPICGNSGL